MTTSPAPRPIDALDVPLPDLERQLAKERFAKRMAPLAELQAHPEYVATAQPAPLGELAEWHHWLYDADTDATTPAFPYPTATPEETL